MAIPLIQTKLSISNLELIRDQIAAILLLELHNQYVLETIDYDIKDVYIERYSPINEEEGLVINCGILGAQYDVNTPISSIGTINYFVDVYLLGTEENNIADGFKLAAAKIQQVTGLIRAIIQNPNYIRLAFAPGFINRRNVEKVDFSADPGKEEGTFFRFSRTTISVVASEFQPENVPISLLSNETQVKLSDTDLGFKYEFLNT